MKSTTDDDAEYSSGLSSDGDIDMINEMDVLRQTKKEQKKLKHQT